MGQESLLELFGEFSLAVALGFLIGLEREMRDKESITLGIRDFVLFALFGAISSFAALQYGNTWLIVAGFLGCLALIVSSYWADRDHGPGVTTEFAALLTFFLGVLIVHEAEELAIALAIVAVGVLFPKRQIKEFRSRVQVYELRAVLLFLTITFIVLPVLPRQSLDTYLSFPVGEVVGVDREDGGVELELFPNKKTEPGKTLDLVTADWISIGRIEITRVSQDKVTGSYQGEQLTELRMGTVARSRLGVEFLDVMSAALKPYKLWLIVVLVSGVSFVGYVLIKLIGSRAGIGLTGLVGGLVSSTVTTLSFARRSTETPEANRLFAMAVILAGSIMFPRLILEVAVVNQILMRNIAVPLITMGVTGFLLAYWLYRVSREQSVEAATVNFDNPFSLKSAVTFGLVFALILMLTRLATTYLGNAWLPVVAIVSGLTDADAIAFSISALQQAGLVSLDWASFNLVLGAISNTFMKLFLVFSLGHRGLFRQLLVSFLVIGTVGIVTMLLYYDLTTIVG